MKSSELKLFSASSFPSGCHETLLSVEKRVRAPTRNRDPDLRLWCDEKAPTWLEWSRNLKQDDGKNHVVALAEPPRLEKDVCWFAAAGCEREAFPLQCPLSICILVLQAV